MRKDALKAILSLLLIIGIIGSVLGLYLAKTAEGKIYIGSSDFKVYAFADLYNLTITAGDGGTTDPEPGMHAYIENTTVTVTAMPFADYGFDHWELNGSSVYSNPINVTMDSNYVLNALFNYGVTIEAFCVTEDLSLDLGIMMDSSPTGYTTPHTFTVVGSHNFTIPETDSNEHPFRLWNTSETSTTIVVSSPGAFIGYYQAKRNLTITEVSGGTTDPAPGEYEYWDGTVVDVTALPSLGYGLHHWVLDTYDAGSSNPISVTMDADHDLQPVFRAIYYLTITATTGGTTDPAPGLYPYWEGSVVEINATADTDYAFDHWELNESSFYVNPINVTMDSNYVLNAAFNHNVTIEAFCITENVTLSLDITMDNSPTNFTTPHMFTLIGTHNFTVPAIDPEGHFFEQWSTGETNTTITVSSPPTLTAYYNKKWWLTIETASGGTTNPSPGKEKYYEGTTVNVTALPSLGYLLDHWVLDTYDAGSSNPISVTMDADHDLQPVFSWAGICKLTITVTAGGNTTPSPGIHEYTNGTLVDVIALSDAGYGLHHWELDGMDIGSENPIEVTMDENHTLNAVFRAIYSLTITTTSGGTTNPAPGLYPYWEGSLVEVTGAANAGWRFDHWELDGSWNYSNPINVKMDVNHFLNATFVYDVTIDANIGVNIIMDASPTGFTTPHTFTGLTGTHTFAVPEVGPGGIRFFAWVWSGLQMSNNINMTVSKGGSYKAYYYDPSFPSGGGRVGGTYYAGDITVLLASHILVTLILLVATMATGMCIKHLRRRERSK